MFPGGPWLIKYAPAALPFKPDSAATIKLTHYQAVLSPSPIATGESLIRYLHVGPGVVRKLAKTHQQPVLSHPGHSLGVADRAWSIASLWTRRLPPRCRLRARRIA